MVFASYEWPAKKFYWSTEGRDVRPLVCSKTKDCHQLHEYPFDMKRHEKNCTDQQSVILKQKVYGCDSDEHARIKKLFPPGFTIPKDVTTFDIETIEAHDNSSDEILLNLLSIAVASTLGESKYFVRKSSEPAAATKLVDEFMDYLYELSVKKSELLPSYVHEELKKVNKQIEAAKLDRSRGVKNRTRFFNLKLKKNTILKCMKLNIYGFNSGKFDMKVLIGPIACYCAKNNWPPPNPMKRGTNYLQVELQHMYFKGMFYYYLRKITNKIRHTQFFGTMFVGQVPETMDNKLYKIDFPVLLLFIS